MVDLFVFRRRASELAEPVIVQASPEEVHRLPIPFGATLDRRALAHGMARGTLRVWRTDRYSAYVAVRGWRGRHDIAEIADSAGSVRGAVVEHALAALARDDYTIALLSEIEWSRNGRWYLERGWKTLERLVIYEHHDVRRAQPPTGRLMITPYSPTDLETVTHIDQTAFPWFWWNEPADFQEYASRESVTVLVARAQGAAIGYLGLTRAGNYGHIDRLAILPAFQGQGLGREILAIAVDYLRASGCRRVGLSTQETNHRARRLYEQFGFRPQRDLQPLWGTWLRPELAPDGRDPIRN